MHRIGVFLLVMALSAGVAIAQDARALVESAVNLNRYGTTLEGEQRQGVLVDVRRILDRVVTEYPNSPEAATIRAGGFLGELNVAVLDAQIRGQSLVPPPPPSGNTTEGQIYGDQLTVSPPELAGIPPAPLDPKERMRAIQQALNSVGCETGTPDGVAGRKTTRGYETFLKEKGLDQALYSMESDAFWQVLQSSQGVVCESMPVVPVTPQTMPGNWTYVANCGRDSRMPGQRITGVVSLRYTGGNGFSGELRNSQGLRAKVVGKVVGRQVTLTTNFGLFFGKVSSRGTVADDAYVVHGRDSNGCRFTATKR